MGCFPTYSRTFGNLEPAGWGSAGTFNAISYILWSIWLIVMGIILLLHKTSTTSA